MNDTFYFVSNYNYPLDWLSEYTDRFEVWDRSNDESFTSMLPQEKVRKVENKGSDWYDKLGWIVENYDNLPETIMLVKGNLWKYISKPEFGNLRHNTCFTPLLTPHHKTYYPVCFYDQRGQYNEINNLWFLNSHPCKCNPLELMDLLGITEQKYVKFAPGSNYIVTKEVIHTKPKSFYGKLRSYLEWDVYPGEAQIIERGIYNIWKNAE